MEFTPYRREVHYYETDKMGFVHHSNYIRWMEEARLDFMRQMGMDYHQMEEQGVIIPVTGVSCAYKRSVYYGESVDIATRLTFFNGVRMAFSYEILRDGALCASGESQHCFLGEGGAPINLKKRAPGLGALAENAVERQ